MWWTPTTARWRRCPRRCCPRPTPTKACTGGCAPSRRGDRRVGLGAAGGEGGDAEAGGGDGGLVAFDAPVLVVDALVLRLVEPDQAEGLVLAHAREQVADLGELPGGRAHGGLRQQDRLGGELAHLVDGLAEHGGEGVGRVEVGA